jgi:hypothetical protein
MCGLSVEAPMRRKKPRPEATPRVAITIRVPLDVEELRRRLEERMNLSTPELFARGLNALEARTAESVAVGTPG